MERNGLEHIYKERAKNMPLKKNWRGFQKILQSFYVFWLVARKPLEILEPIIALEVVCICKKSYLWILGWIKHSNIIGWCLGHYIEKPKHNRMELMQVIQEVSLTFPDTKDFTGEKLEQKYANENNENVAAKDKMDHSSPWLSSSFRCFIHCEFSSAKSVVRRCSIK